MTDQTITLPSDAPTQTTQVEQARAVAEVRAAILVAQGSPRDLRRAELTMRDACGRLATAERAFYKVPNRGEGPSVHLARELARIWQNLDYGVRELRRDDEAGMSEIQAFCWDQEANVRSTRTFQVPHQRMKKVNGRQTRDPLTDLGDVYLNNQNIGARAVRECIFTVLPSWFVQTATEVCRQTLRDGEGVPLGQRIDRMVQRFAGHGVTVAQLERVLERRRGQWSPDTLADAVVLYQALEEGKPAAELFPDEQDVRVTAGELTGSNFPAGAEPAAGEDPWAQGSEARQ